MSATAAAATAATATVEPWLPPPMVEIFVKTMTGDLLPLTVCNNACLEQIAQQITRAYPEYPVNRVRVFYLPNAELEEKEEKKEHLHQEGDILMMMVLDPPVKETGVWSDGEPYTRFAFPFQGNTVYVYVSISHDHAHYGVTKHSDIPSPRMIRHSGFVLYDLLTSYCKWITLEEITEFYAVLFPYIDELGKEKGKVYGHQFNPSEPRKCGCGSVVKRSGMTSHTKTKKHQNWLKTQ